MRSSVTNSDTNPDAMIAEAICTEWVCIFRLAGASGTTIRIVESITPNHVMSGVASRVTDGGVSESQVVIEELSPYDDRL